MTTLKRMDVNPGPYELTVSGLQLSGESTPEQWEQCGQALKQVDEARQWAIGDWLCDGKKHYGDGLYKRATRVGNAPNAAVRVVSIRIAQVMLHVAHQGIEPVDEIQRAIGAKLQIGGTEVSIAGREQGYRLTRFITNLFRDKTRTLFTNSVLQNRLHSDAIIE